MHIRKIQKKSKNITVRPQRAPEGKLDDEQTRNLGIEDDETTREQASCSRSPDLAKAKKQ